MTQSIQRLPLFLLNTVLFPGMPLNLYIFEDRYKQMIHECQEGELPFGVVLIQQGREAGGPLAVPYEVGCLAKINKLESLSEGRYNLVAVGGERFRILSLQHDRPYLVADVELIPLKPGVPEEVAWLENKLRPQIDRYIHLLIQEGADDLLKALPEDPLSFAYVASIILQISPQEKQEFLECPEAVSLLKRLLDVYRKELVLVKKIIQSNPGREDKPFSNN
jgi:Lon protease-like protein